MFVDMQMIRRHKYNVKIEISLCAR